MLRGRKVTTTNTSSHSHDNYSSKRQYNPDAGNPRTDDRPPSEGAKDDDDYKGESDFERLERLHQCFIQESVDTINHELQTAISKSFDTPVYGLAARYVLQSLFPTNGIYYFYLIVLAMPWECYDRVRLIRAFQFAGLWQLGYVSREKFQYQVVYYGLPVLIQFAAIMACYEVDHFLSQVNLMLPNILGRWILEKLIAMYSLSLSSGIINLTAELISERPHILGGYFHLGTFAGVLVESARPVRNKIFSNRSLLNEYESHTKNRALRKALGTAKINTFDRVKQEYEYQRLGEREIRLVRVVKKTTPESLECKLITKSLDNVPKYYAISYVWGIDKATHWMSIDGKWLPTTSSTFEILHGHVADWFSGHHAYIWIDYLCINQKDLEEKGSQVQLMREIYSKASSVVGFLQPQNWIESDIAAAFLQNKLSDIQSTVRRRDVTIKPSTFMFRRSISAFLACITRRSGAPGWNAMTALLANAYWKRVWIVQELVLAPNLRIFYGHNELSWDEVQEIVNLCLNNDEKPIIDQWNFDMLDASSFQLHELSPGLQRIRQTFRFRTWHLKQEEGPNFKDLLLAIRSMDAKDSRDYIFGLQGLLRQPLQLPNSILPEYTSTTSRDLYINVAKYLLGENDQGWILRMAGIGSGPGRCFTPSWTPDWTTVYPVPLPHEQVSSCSRRTYMPLKIREDKIHLLGCTVDRVFTVETACVLTNMKDGFPYGLYNYKDYWTKFLSFMTLVHTLPMDKLGSKALARTLTAGTIENQHLDFFERFLKHLLRLHETMQKLLGPSLGFSENQSFKPRLTALRVLHSMQIPNLGDWEPDFQYCKLRSLAVTHSGHLALVPQHTKPGDTVHVIHGTGSFFVLRKFASESASDQDEYQLVGDCYINPGYFDCPLSHIVVR